MSHIGSKANQSDKLDKNSTVNIYQQSSAVGGFSGFGLTSGSGRANVASSQLSTYNRIANIGKLNKISKANAGNATRSTVGGASSLQNSQHLKGKFYQTQVLKKMGSTADSHTAMAAGTRSKNLANMNDAAEASGVGGDNNSYSNQTYQNKTKGIEAAAYFYRPGNNSS